MEHKCEGTKSAHRLDIFVYEGNWIIQAVDDDHYWDVIKYCPFCGKELAPSQ